MIEENALVINAVEDDNRYVWVQTQRKTACGSCSAKAGCGTQLLSKLFGQKSNRVKVLNPCDAKPGDHVVIGLEDEAVLKGSFVLYFIPLVSLILFSMVGNLIAKALIFSVPMIDLTSIACAVLGLTFGILAVRIYMLFGLKKNPFGANPCDANPYESNPYEAKVIKILPHFGISYQ